MSESLYEPTWNGTCPACDQPLADNAANLTDDMDDGDERVVECPACGFLVTLRCVHVAECEARIEEDPRTHPTGDTT